MFISVVSGVAVVAIMLFLSFFLCYTYFQTYFHSLSSFFSVNVVIDKCRVRFDISLTHSSRRIQKTYARKRVNKTGKNQNCVRNIIKWTI